MKSRKIWLQVLAWLLCTAIAAGLVYVIRDDRQKNAERIAQLQAQAGEQEKSDGEKLEALRGIYEKFYSRADISDFVCWGDSAMAGSRGTSLAISLQKVMEENLFARLTKSFGRVLEKGVYQMPSITINNMGVINEGMRQILVRAGVNTMEIGDWIQIPADTDPVDVRLMDDEAWDSDIDEDSIKFARQREVGFGQVWIRGVEGTLIATDDWYDSNHPRFAFVRDEEGSQQSAGAGTEVEIESANMYIGSVPIFFFENETGRSTDGFVSDVKDLVDRYADTEEDDEEAEETQYDLPFVVIFSTNEGSAMDKAMMSAFGDRYIRNDGYSNEMTEKMYKKLAQRVYESLDAQGCFDGIKEQIALAVQEAGEL